MNINLDGSLLLDDASDDMLDAPYKYPSIYGSRASSRLTSDSFTVRDSESISIRNREFKDSAMQSAPNMLRAYLDARYEAEVLEKEKMKRKRITHVLGTLVPLIMCIVLFCFQNKIDQNNANVGRCMGIIVLISGWWLAAPIPTIAVSLTPVFLFPMSGILSGSDVAKSYFSYVQMLLIGAFLVDLCIEESRLAQRFGLKGISLFIESSGVIRPSRLVIAFMCTAYFLSLLVSNMSVVIMLLPFCISIIDKIEEVNKDYPEDVHRFSVAVLLGVAFAANCGGMATSIGTTANMVFINDMDEFYGPSHTPSFAKFFLLCWLPSLCLFLAACAVVGVYWCRNLRHLKVPHGLASEELRKLGPMDSDQYIVLIAQLSQVVLWFGRSVYYGFGWRDIDDGTIAIFCAFPLFFIPSSQRPGQRILTKEMVMNLDWEVLLLLGAGFAIAAAVDASKMDNFVATGIGTGNTDTPLFVVVLVSFTAVAVLTEFASSAATANVLLPILAMTAVHSQLHPIALMLPAALGCSCAFCFPMATPSNAIIYSTGRVTLGEMAHTGKWLSIGAIVIIPFCVLFYTLPVGGYGNYHSAPRPDWADITTPSPTPF